MQRHNDPMRYKLPMNAFPRLYMGAMRLAKKYDAERLYSEFQHILLRLFPKTSHEAQRTFAMYRANEDAQLDWATSHRQICDDWELAQQHWPDAGEYDT